MAVTIAVVSIVTAGAVNKPPFVMLPGEAVHVTPVLLLLLTMALNCSVAEDATVDVGGEIETEIGTTELVLPVLTPEQASDRAVRQTIANIPGIALLAWKVSPLWTVPFPAMLLAGMTSPGLSPREKNAPSP